MMRVRVPQVVKVRQHVRSVPLAKVKKQKKKQEQLIKPKLMTEEQKRKAFRLQHRLFVRTRFSKLVRVDGIPIAILPIVGGVSFLTPLVYIKLTESSHILQYGHIEVGKRGNLTQEEADVFEYDGYFSLRDEDSFSVHEFLKRSKLLARYNKYVADFITRVGTVSLKEILSSYLEVEECSFKKTKLYEAFGKEGEEPECPICCGESPVNCSSSSCSHVFCQKCIQNWAAASATENTCCTCPMCRVEIKTVVLKLKL